MSSKRGPVKSETQSSTNLHLDIPFILDAPLTYPSTGRILLKHCIGIVFITVHTMQASNIQNNEE